MKLHATLFLAGALANTTVVQPGATAFAANPGGQVTILYAWNLRKQIAPL